MRGSRVVVLATASAVALGVAYLTLPPMGSDLAAQVARADFFVAHGLTPVDLRWYGGVQQFGYSLVAQPVMALLGVRLTGVVALVAAATAFAALLVRTRVPRPLLGSLVGVVTIAGNLVSGRVTYGLGVAFGLAALLALTWHPAARPTGGGARPRPRRPGNGDSPRPGPAGNNAGPRHALASSGGWWRLGLAGAGALLASATSPVAGLFVGLAGVALLLSRRYADGLLLAVAAALPLGVTALLFGDGGWMNISRTDTVRAAVTALLVAALVGYRPVRLGALLAAGGVVAAALVHTPVGLNATRLATVFALPVLAAAARPPAWLTRLPSRLRRPGTTVPPDGEVPARRTAGVAALVVLLAAVCWWQPPVVPADLRSIGEPTSDPGYFAPLRAELDRRGRTGRLEVPPTRNYWEAARLGDVPLARGWLRQADIDRNPLFFTTVPGAAGTGVPLTVESYRAWLDENAVQYVAVPDAPLSWVGRAEAELVTAGLPYLTEVWSDQRWRLYAVADPTPLVGAPGELVHADGASVTFRATEAGTVSVRVRHSRWLAATGGATVSADGDWTAVAVPRAGTYTVGG
ncbi:hypothetical protein C1I95_09375 [Micromonospora craterilacus]|uniref:Uncharacterized protein n=1 Tax=Micromonospora craterilacus TaxID=1655439 RepID=A0A2W2EDG9_9ACTN|nr:hypothetical protein [Micromonospora craterilacus]PZG20563.1 hypothetical protein C1I95_09375 [Micromonospora craterilacus]